MTDDDEVRLAAALDKVQQAQQVLAQRLAVVDEVVTVLERKAAEAQTRLMKLRDTTDRDE